MILIPQRLFSDQNVRTILRDGNNCVLMNPLCTSACAHKKSDR